MIVEARDIKKVYKMGAARVEALRGLDITVQGGEFLGVMGPSGAGKSTLMHILGCLDSPSEGIYLLGGQDVSYLSDRELSLIRATKIGFVFQTFNLIPQCSVFENVKMPFLYRKEDSADAVLRTERAIERVGLASRRRHKPNELSGGEMQRVAIARALVNNPSVVLCDEPTGNIDSKTGKEIMEILRKLNREQQQTFVIVTHDPFVAESVDRIAHMQDGLIVREEILR